jgi:hypothetical protein
MNPIRLAVVAAPVAALLTAAVPAWAQANRTFVSGAGSDANPCTLAAPCRSFAQALTQTNAGGEITILDPAGYGPVTITKSVSIINDGVGEAGVTTVSATDAIDISVGASDVVNLRGLTLVGGGVGNTGIKFTNLGALNVQNCVMRGFNSGLGFFPTGAATLSVSDTVASNNVGGIGIEPTGSGTVTAVFNRVQVIGPSSGSGFSIAGMFSTGALNVTITDSTASGSPFGIANQSLAGKALSQVMVSNSVLSNNATGVFDTGANSFTYMSRNTITGNTMIAYSVTNSGALFSFGDNYIKSNANDGGALSSAMTK